MESGNPPNLQLLAFKSILASILRFPLLRSLFTQHGTVYDSNIPQDIDWELPLQHQIAQANQEWLYYHQLVSYVVFGNTIAPLVDGVFDDLGRISDSKLHIVGELLPLISFW